MDKTIQIKGNTTASKNSPKDWEKIKPALTLGSLMSRNSVSMYFEEKVDQKEDEDRFILVVESTKIPGYKRKYSAKNYREISRDLLANGYKANEIDLTRILKMLADDFRGNKLGWFHTGIGWFEYEGKTAFRYNSVVTCDQELQSKYRGKLELEQKGTLEQYIQGIRELVVPYPKLFTVYIAGASGIVIQALKKADTNIIMNIYGESSSGKTTAEEVALSFWGKPEAPGFNTINRTEEILAQRIIMPTILDDMLSACSSSGEKAKQREVLEHIFRFSTGRIKGRMGQTDLKFYGAAIASSEIPLLSKTLNSDTTGQFYRMIELSIRRGELTKDAEHAKRLEKLIQQNYGLGAYELGKYMVQHNYIEDGLSKIYDEEYKSLVEDKRLSQYCRAANRLAILLVAARLINECFELHAQIDIIKEVLISAVVQSTKPLDKRKAAYKELESLIAQNRKAFSDTQEDFKLGQHIGVYRKNVYGNHEVIIPTKYMMPLLHGIPINQILVDSGDERVRQPQNYELRNILTHWKQQGWLQYAGRGDQLYLKRKLGDIKKQVLVYVVVLGIDNEEG